MYRKQSPKVCLIIVLYHPSNMGLRLLMKEILEETLDAVFIDNTPQVINNELLSYTQLHINLHYYPLLKNKGIAEAQNIGIKEAQKIEGISHVLFLDQDSQIEEGFISEMIKEYERIIKLEPNIAALGPTLRNQNNNSLYKQEKVKIENRGKDFHLPTKLISSGMLVSLKTMEHVGYMDSSLFIDAVDFEWCWRAKARGYKCCMTERVQLLHKVGEKDSSILGYKVLISAPIRYYYQYRNLIILIRRKYVPLNWKIKNIIKKIFFLVYIPLCSPNGRQIITNMMQGIKDGFSSRKTKNSL